jgi:hypothetical protein
MSLTCVVLGSFKAKPTIDKTIQEFTDLGVKVLAPEPGGLYKSDFSGFYPLESELKLDPGTVEQQFINHLRETSFAYLVNPNGYIGETVSMEIGFCLAGLIPLFTMCVIDPTLDDDPSWKEYISWVMVRTPEEAVKLQTPPEVWRPNIVDTIIYSRR